MRSSKLDEIALQHLGPVALGIDGDEKRPQVSAFVAGRPQRLRDLEQRGRADVRAMGEAEENEMRLAQKIAIRHGAAVLIDQRERSADRGRRGLTRRRRKGQNGGGAKRGETDAERQKRQGKPPGGRGHASALNRFRSTRRAPREPCR